MRLVRLLQHSREETSIAKEAGGKQAEEYFMPILLTNSFSVCNISPFCLHPTAATIIL